MTLEDLANQYVSKADVLAQKGDCYDAEGHLLYAVGTGNILRLPAADVKPVVRGEWIELGKYIDGYNWRCSVCKRESTMAINYCPNCGADMREQEVKV